jgi:hypothetical protein
VSRPTTIRYRRLVRRRPPALHYRAWSEARKRNQQLYNPHLHRTSRLPRVLAVLLAAALVFALVRIGAPLVAAGDRVLAQLTPADPAPRAPVSTQATVPLVYGSNLALYDTTDQVVNDPRAQELLRQARVPILRMPFRSRQGDIYEVKALRAIQYVGAIPVVIVHGAADPQALADDLHLIALVRAVFGTDTVYVEFGNEPDRANIGADSYAAAWNAVIPSLKSIAPSYKFIGPAIATADAAYLATFDRLAIPRPDALSYHEYVCPPQGSDAYCIDHISDWATHIEKINAAVRGANGTSVPVMITEWNVDSSPDVRFANAGFMREWTEQALQTLAALQPMGLVAAMQYCVSNNPQYGLVDAGNALTPQGEVWVRNLRLSSAPNR